MILTKMEDHIWEKQEITQVRHTVRVIAKNQDGLFAFLKLEGNDEFGIRNHLETIGGGIEDGESEINAIKREVKEEIGYSCKIIEKIGIIIDYYHLLNRETYSHFYFVELLDNSYDLSRTPFETKMIKDLVWLKEESVIPTLLNIEKNTIGELIHRRDCYAFETYLKRKYHSC